MKKFLGAGSASVIAAAMLLSVGGSGQALAQTVNNLPVVQAVVKTTSNAAAIVAPTAVPTPSVVSVASDVAKEANCDPSALRKWEATALPTLVMDGTLFMGQAEPHAFMRHGADELARVLPNARRLTLEGQDHGPADETLVPALKAFFLA